MVTFKTADHISKKNNRDKCKEKYLISNYSILDLKMI